MLSLNGTVPVHQSFFKDLLGKNTDHSSFGAYELLKFLLIDYKTQNNHLSVNLLRLPATWAMIIRTALAAMYGGSVEQSFPSDYKLFFVGP